MSTSTKRRGRRLPLLAVVAAAFGLFLTLGAGNAFALSCTATALPAPQQVTVTLNAGETVTMSVGAGDAITATGAGGSINCGATTSTTSQINVFGTDAGNETLIIDEGVGGRFEPGFPADPIFAFGNNEIEWYVNLGEDLVDQADPASRRRGLLRRQRHARDQRHTDRRCRAYRRGRFLRLYDGVAPTVLPALPVSTPVAITPVLGTNLVNLNSFPGDVDADILGEATDGAGRRR